MNKLKSGSTPSARTAFTQFHQLLIPPESANGLSLGKAFVATTILALIIFVALALLTIIFGGIYWFFFM